MATCLEYVNKVFFNYLYNNDNNNNNNNNEDDDKHNHNDNDNDRFPKIPFPFFEALK